jgi:preprotein translocase subunit Sec63
LRLAEEKEAAELSAQQEAEKLALQQAAQLEALKLAEEKEAAELSAQQEAEDQQEQDKAIASTVDFASDQKSERVSKVHLGSEPNQRYTIQLLSLAKFSQARLDYYCKKHKLDTGMVTKKRLGEWTKIYYGQFETKSAALSVREELVQNHNLMDTIVIVL